MKSQGQSYAIGSRSDFYPNRAQNWQGRTRTPPNTINSTHWYAQQITGVTVLAGAMEMSNREKKTGIKNNLQAHMWKLQLVECRLKIPTTHYYHFHGHSDAATCAPSDLTQNIIPKASLTCKSSIQNRSIVQYYRVVGL